MSAIAISLCYGVLFLLTTKCSSLHLSILSFYNSYIYFFTLLKLFRHIQCVDKAEYCPRYDDIVGIEKRLQSPRLVVKER